MWPKVTVHLAFPQPVAAEPTRDFAVLWSGLL